jgi:hypothetical protein
VKPEDDVKSRIWRRNIETALKMSLEHAELANIQCLTQRRNQKLYFFQLILTFFNVFGLTEEL